MERIKRFFLKIFRSKIKFKKASFLIIIHSKLIKDNLNINNLKMRKNTSIIP